MLGVYCGGDTGSGSAVFSELARTLIISALECIVVLQLICPPMKNSISPLRPNKGAGRLSVPLICLMLFLTHRSTTDSRRVRRSPCS